MMNELSNLVTASRLVRWGDEVSRLVAGEEVVIELNGRNPTSIRTVLRSALLHRGFALRSQRSPTQIRCAAINLRTPEGIRPKKDANLGRGATNVAFVVSALDFDRLKAESDQRGETVSAAVRNILHEHWDRKDKTSG